MLNKWKTRKSENGPDLTIFNVRFDHIENPRNGKIIKATVLETNDSANVVAFTKEGKILMIRQFRFGTGEYTLELPGGFIEKGEPSDLAVKRELVEETGYTSSEWTYLGFVPANPVFMDSKVHHYLAKNAHKTAIPKLDDGEDVELVALTAEEVIEKAQQGIIAHPHTLTALVRVIRIWT